MTVLFSVIMLCGGLAFFLFGMHQMSGGLERMAGGKLERALKKLTSTQFKSLLLGAGITVAVQSSSAVTVMLVGLVNSGILDISRTAGVIMGSNIGTTLTAWLLSLVGIQSDNVWIQLLKPENFSLLFALVGIVLIMISKNEKRKDIGSVLVGFAVLMYGMKLMSDAVSPLAEMPEFARVLTLFRNPLLGVLVGALFTGIIQSSAASVGILQALALTGNITYGMAIPIIMGQNIGTCVTALISCIGVSKNAKKVAVIHISFNVIGTAVLLALYLGADAIFDLTFTDSAISATAIAAVHSVFNVATTALLFPFSKLIVKLADLLIKNDEMPKPAESAFVPDTRLLATPSVAVSECDAVTSRMALLSRDTLFSAFDITKNYSAEKAEQITADEDSLDKYEDSMGTYLVQLASKQLSDGDSLRVSLMLHSIGDFERLGDHAVNILDSAKELYDKNLTFSESATHELGVLTAALTEIITSATDAYVRNDEALACTVEPLEQVIDGLVASIKARHVARLKNGECSIELGFILSDLLGNYERISDHCSNISVAIIELNRHSFDTHRYLDGVRYDDPEFRESYDKYSEKYRIN